MSTRRRFLAGAGASASAVAFASTAVSSAGVSPDAEIISIAEEYVRLSRLWCDIAREGGSEIGYTPLAISCLVSNLLTHHCLGSIVNR